jgi:hypothetical protein
MPRCRLLIQTSIINFSVISLPLDAGKVVHYSGNAVSSAYIKTPYRHFPRAVGCDQSAPVNYFSYGRERKMAVVSSGKRGQVRGWYLED